MKVNLINDVGVKKQLKVGFSFTTLFFGGLVNVFRGQWIELIKWFFLVPATFGIYGIVQLFTTNKKYIIATLEQGYRPMSMQDEQLLKDRNIIV